MHKILITSLLIISELGYIQGKKLGFTCNDPLISHKFNGDTISSAVLIAGSFLLPLVVLLITEILGKQTVKKLHGAELWSIYKECLVGVMLVLSITQVAKLIIGEHRPHFLDVCEPDANRNCVNGSFVQDYTCTTKRFKGYFLVDTSRSFPSAHSSVSVFIGLFSAAEGYGSKCFLTALFVQLDFGVRYDGIAEGH
ncbi:hypothetical protein NQ318_023439 [Aromia moschata]|uniref:Phosphatidic acid phosphatase type 2/haloperoxidase domain-containing protein n=1 Tax=Aromia moschata TaxID=1265417 RepID=A0AAV8XUB1_9CUCU|nr:hypothetical protein NQ318_023439 [Aromia moschata]